MVTAKDFLASSKRVLAISSLALAFTIYGAAAGHLPTSQALADSAQVVRLYHDGQKHIFTTEAQTVGEVLQRAKVELGPHDLVEPAATTTLDRGVFNINVYRAQPVVVVDGQQEYPILTAYQSPRLVAQAAGVYVYPEDQFTQTVVSDLVVAGTIGTRVVIDRATPVMLLADRRSQEMRTQAKTVADFLTEKQIALGPKDTIEPELKTPITADVQIKISRVNDVTEVKEEVIPRQVKTISDPNQLKGYRHVKTEGSDGQKRVTYRVHFRDGEETARQVLKTETLSKPVTQVVVVGTKLVVGDDVWYRLRLCESGNDYTKNTGNGYYGAYQFSLSTWQSNGGSGYPHQAAPSEQDYRARLLQSRRGWSPWPVCSRKLGLR